MEYPEEIFDRVFAVNVKAMWLGMKLVAPALISRGGGAIVNTASIAGLRASPGLLAYTASKHAVIGMTRTASVELACHGVRVNAVCPAPIDTPMGQQLDEGFDPQNPKAAHERFLSRIPMGRYGQPEEVAALVAFLFSADASFINGGIYTIDGGAMSWSMNMFAMSALSKASATSDTHLSRTTANATPAAPGQLGLAVFVDNLAQKAGNARRSLEEGQVRLVRGVFRVKWVTARPALPRRYYQLLPELAMCA
jgi:hypothetical protein